MNKFVYKGSVYAFSNLVSCHWEAETYAVSLQKARSNLKFQFRKQFNYSQQTPIELPDNLIEIK